ncbi:hypothetical protein HOLleu_42632 [Holothuria leucospilota]|uniref:Uncharacterized protein n=1 Tax=Holothuria leucospilota TaxID=206669 RepID=A0A9Q0YCM8_HOLLE|nr:hypothetical protein HOLleu_42632 [Holothuria leucospilota]
MTLCCSLEDVKEKEKAGASSPKNRPTPPVQNSPSRKTKSSTSYVSPHFKHHLRYPSAPLKQTVRSESALLKAISSEAFIKYLEDKKKKKIEEEIQKQKRKEEREAKRKEKADTARQQTARGKGKEKRAMDRFYNCDLWFHIACTDIEDPSELEEEELEELVWECEECL